MLADQAFWIAMHWAGKKTMKPARMMGERDDGQDGNQSRKDLREQMKDIEEEKGFGEVIKLGSGDEEVVIALEEELALDDWPGWDEDLDAEVA